MPSLSPLRLLAAAVLATGAPLVLSAQASETLPFEAGRWAVELSSTGRTGNLGFLRFTSPSGAWIVAPGLTLSRGSGDIEVSDAGAGTFDGDVDSDFVAYDLRLGRRQYHGLGGSAVSFLGFGLRGFAEMFNGTSDLSDGSQTIVQDIDEEAFGGGVYGELGGSWFFTRRIGIGAVAIADLTVAQVRSVSEIRDDFGVVTADEIETRDWTFDLAQTRLMVTIVF